MYYNDLLLGTKPYFKTSISKIAFLGDSLTDINCDTAWSICGYRFPPSHQRYAQMVANALGVEAIFQGIGGDTAYNMQYRLDDDIISGNPSHCIVICGGNDIYTHGRNANEILIYIKDIVTALQKEKIIPILMWLPISVYTGGTISQTVQQQSIMAMNPTLKNYTITNNIHYIEFDGTELGTGYTVNAKYYLPDGIHPSIYSGKYVSDIIITKLKEWFPCQKNNSNLQIKLVSRKNVSNIEVKVENNTLITNENGICNINLPAGTYKISAEIRGKIYSEAVELKGSDRSIRIYEATVIGLEINPDIGDNGTWSYVDINGQQIETTFDFNDIYPWAEIEEKIIDGQYMMKIPKFYVKYGYNANGCYCRWISNYPMEGFKIHQAFLNEGKTLDCFYLSKYIAGDGGGTTACSLPNIVPLVSLNSDQMDLKCFNINTVSNTGWHRTTIAELSALWLLMLVEYGSVTNISKNVPVSSTKMSELKSGTTTSIYRGISEINITSGWMKVAGIRIDKTFNIFYKNIRGYDVWEKDGSLLTNHTSWNYGKMMDVFKTEGMKQLFIPSKYASGYKNIYGNLDCIYMDDYSKYYDWVILGILNHYMVITTTDTRPDGYFRISKYPQEGENIV